MNHEIYVPPVGDIEPMIEGRQPWLPESMELSFSKHQREWWLRVYTNGKGVPQCGFQEYNEDKGFFRCAATQQLQIHHIVPNAWTEVHHPEKDPNDIKTTYGIALCKFHHTEYIHPDIKEAFRNYGADHGSIAKAVKDHRELAKQGIKFWDDSWDEQMWETARRYVLHYMKNHPYDSYPQDPHWQAKWKQ